MFRYIYFIIFSFLLIPSKDIASVQTKQNDSIKFILEAKLHYGFIISHHDYMDYLVTGHFPAIEVNIGKQTHGEKQWQQLYKYPEMGITFWYANLANPNVLGSAYAIYPYLNFHLYQSNYFSLNFRFGTGLGYLTKRFDRLNDYKNIAIGSHVNVTINMFYEFKWKLFNKCFLSGGIGLTHFSNGAFKTPNLGLNIPTVNLGISYIIKHDEKSAIVHNIELPKEKRKIEIQAFLAGGIKEITPACGDTYGAFSFSTNFLKPLSLKRKVGIGLDLFWEFSNIRTLKENNIDVKHNYEVIRQGIHIGHQFEFSRLSFATEVGYYLYAMGNGDGPVYTVIALRYKISKKLLFNIALKTHMAKADFVGYGIGYVLK